MECNIGIDIGGTNIKIVYMVGNDVIKQHFQTVREHNGAHILNDIILKIEKFISNKKFDTINIGVGVPGPVHNGIINECVNIGWKNVDVIQDIKNILSVHANVFCINDANATLYSEVLGKYSSAVLLTLGTGVGGGIYIGDIIEGFDGCAGEVGHMHMNNKYNFKCNCGKSNCLETLVSATGISNIYKFKTNKVLDCRSIFDNALNNDIIAVEVIDEVCEYIAVALSRIALCINPEVIIIGGGVSMSKGLLLDKIKYYYKEYSFTQIIDTKIIRTTQGSYSGSIGAALYAKEKGKFIV